jgi:carbon storage regulator
MLVLSRRIGEEIHIGNDIVITVLASRGHQVKIGIQAPAAIPVFRAELLASASASAPLGAREVERHASCLLAHDDVG